MSTVKADHKWFKDWKGTEEKEKRYKVLANSRNIFEDLKAILEDLVEEKRKVSESESQFDNPNWANKEAYQLGVRKGIQVCIELIPKIKD